MVLLVAMSTAAACADDAATVRKIYDQVKPSLVAVKYTWANELGSQELTAAGVIVSDDGLVAFPIGIVTPALIPRDQMQKFKIVVPSDTGDETEIDATFQGRDERTSLAFVRPDSPQKWKSIKFEDISPETGDPLYSVGHAAQGGGIQGDGDDGDHVDATARAGAANAGVGATGGRGGGGAGCTGPRHRHGACPRASARRCWIIRRIRTIFRWCSIRPGCSFRPGISCRESTIRRVRISRS